ncbi:MAG: lysophospholipid acyltransferase family protein [Phycisphaerales bacterium]
MSEPAKLGRPVASAWRQFLGWDLGRPFCEFWMRVLYNVRIEGREHLDLNAPRTPTVIVANHQSLLDPITIGIAIKPDVFRPIARRTLFDHAVVGWLLDCYRAIPVDQSRGDRAAIEAGMEAVRSGSPLIVYPEGTRTPDGRVQEFQRGFLLIARRTHARIVPMAIEGAYDVWPTGQPWPRLWGHITLRIGQPISPEEIAAHPPAAFITSLRDRIESMRLDLRAQLRSAEQNGER